LTIIDELRRSSTMAMHHSAAHINVAHAAIAETRAATRTLAGATVLQIVPTLEPSHASRVAVAAAPALVRAGGRPIGAGEGGPLAAELQSFGGEWQSYPDTTFNPIKLRSNVELLARVVENEQIDVVHARSAGAAWSALPIAERYGIKLVTEL